MTSSTLWTASLADSGVAADAASLTGDGTLSRADALQLMRDVASRGAVTSAEFTSLQAVVANMNLSFAADDAVASALIQVVDGNPANAFWNGGSSTATALGNLQSGTTSAQLNELLAKWFLGTDLPDPTLVSGPSLAYRSLALPLFGPAGPIAADINQGADGDCVLDAALVELAVNHPDLVRSMFRDNGDGTYAVRFFVDGAEIWETVNRQLPVTSGGSLEYSNSGSNPSPSLWVPLLEKAYAQLSATGLTDHPAINSYNNIDADPQQTVLANLTGSIAQDYWTTDGAWSTYKALFIAALASGEDIMLGTGAASTDNTYDSNGRLMLVAQHEHAIVGYDAATGNFIVRNPWGAQSWQYWDTQFEVSMADMVAVQGVVTIDNVARGTLAIAPAPQRIENGKVSTTIWVQAGAAVPVATLFTATDTAGNPITQYLLQAIGSDVIALNGAVNLASAAQQAQGQYVVSAADLAKVTFTPAHSSGATALLVAAGDGTSWSPLTPLQINEWTPGGSTVIAAGPGAVSSLSPDATVALAKLVAVKPNATYVQITTSQATVNLNGATNLTAAPGTTFIHASDLPLLTVTAPKSSGAIDLSVSVYLNSAWSAASDIIVQVAQSASAAAQAFKNGQALPGTSVADSLANICANLDALQAMLARGALQQLVATDATAPAVTLTGSQLAADAGVVALVASSISATDVSVATAMSLPAGIAAAITALTITDTAANLIANHAIAHATAYKLSANATDLSAAQAAILESITGFSPNGHVLTVADTAANLIANHSFADATAYRLSANATGLSTAQAASLEAIAGFSANGHQFTVADTAANLIANHAFADASGYALSADAPDLSRAQLVALTSIAGFSANGHVYTVLDTATNLLAARMPGAYGYKLSASGAALSCADAATLEGLAGFNANGQTFNVVDTAANLIANHGLRDAAGYQLAADATGLSAGQATALAAITGLSANGHTVSVSDTADAVFSALAALEPLAAAGALGKVTLSTTPAAPVTLTEAQLHGANDVVADLSGSLDLVVSMQGAHTLYTIGSGSSGLSISGDGQTENLANVDRLVFTDGYDMSFDAAGDPGQAYRIYQAAFDRAPDLAGLGYWIKTLDAGANLTDVANAFVQSKEFSDTYGALDPSSYVNQMYLNVLHRPADPGGAAYWTPLVANGNLTRAQVLEFFSESPENQAALVATIQHGITYVA